MPTKEQIIYALRCQANKIGIGDCKNCPYRKIEEPSETMKEAGFRVWETCDYMAVYKDAADLLEGEAND